MIQLIGGSEQNRTARSDIVRPPNSPERPKKRASYRIITARPHFINHNEPSVSTQFALKIQNYVLRCHTLIQLTSMLFPDI